MLESGVDASKCGTRCRRDRTRTAARFDDKRLLAVAAAAVGQIHVRLRIFTDLVDNGVLRDADNAVR